MANLSELELREKVIAIGKKMLANNLVQGTWGNISIRLDDNHMIVTPSGLDYDRLKPADLPIVDMTTLEWTGPLKPTSEKKIHADIMLARPEIGAVIHSHPVNSSILACAHVEMPVMNDEMAHFVGASVKTAKYGIPGTKGLAKSTVEAMNGRNACFMANHGVTCCGATIEDAYETCRVMESSALQFINQSALEETGAAEFSEELILGQFINKYKK